MAAMKAQLPSTSLPESPPVTPRPTDAQAKRAWERDCRVFREKLNRFGEWIRNQDRHLARRITHAAREKLTKCNPYI